MTLEESGKSLEESGKSLEESGESPAHGAAAAGYILRRLFY